MKGIDVDERIFAIKKYGNKGSRYKPRYYDVFYPLRSMDFIRTGFYTICPTLSARDYKDPKLVLVPKGEP